MKSKNVSPVAIGSANRSTYYLLWASIIPALLNDEQAPTKNKARTVQNVK